MPELPEATRQRLLDMDLTRRDADVLMDVDSGREVRFDGQLGPGPVDYFDEVSRGRDPKVVVNWCASRCSCSLIPVEHHSRITHELLGQLAFRHESFGDNPISTAQMGELIDLVQKGIITGSFQVVVSTRGLWSEYECFRV